MHTSQRALGKIYFFAENTHFNILLSRHSCHFKEYYAKLWNDHFSNSTATDNSFQVQNFFVHRKHMTLASYSVTCQRYHYANEILLYQRREHKSVNENLLKPYIYKSGCSKSTEIQSCLSPFGPVRFSLLWTIH